MKKIIISLLFLAVGVTNSALAAYIAAGSFKIVREYPDTNATLFLISGYTSIVLSLMYLTAGVILAIKGTDNMVGMDDDEEYQHHLDRHMEQEQGYIEE